LTDANYQNINLSYAHPCGKDHKIKLNDFLGKDFVTVKHNDTLHTCKKDCIYAYVDCGFI